MSVKSGKMRALSPVRTVFDNVEFAMDTASLWGESVTPDFGDSAIGKAGQMATLMTVVTLGITLLVGILVFSEIQTSLPTPSNSELDNASGNVTSTFADVMDLAPIIMLALVASLILAVVQNFRGQ